MPSGQPQPRAIGPYRILDLLGEGGMGVVYRAQHRERGERVALKTVRVVAEHGLSNIRREMRTLSRLRHPGVVRVVATGVEQGVPWYAMELIEGKPLDRYCMDLALKSGGVEVFKEHLVEPTRILHGVAKTAPIQPGQDKSHDPDEDGRFNEAAGGQLPLVLTAMRRLCLTLAYLHGEGVVHRDLKPANIIIQPTGELVLVDFGVTVRFGAKSSRESLQVGFQVGTALYMAPEQAQGELVDARADLYSVGCLLYELIAGRPVFVGGSASGISMQHILKAPTPPSRWVEGISEELEELILSLLAKRPSDRPGHAQDVAKRLVELGADPTPFYEEYPARDYLYRPDMVEREEPLRRAQDLLERAKEPGTRVALVSGESGVGKTRLAMEVVRYAESRGFRVVIGECVGAGSAGQRLSGSVAPLLQPFRPLLQAVVDRCREKGPEETRELLGAQGRALELFEPTLESLPGMEGVPEPPPLPPRVARFRLFTTLAQVMARFARVQPLLMIIDDLHGADELTLDFLDHVLRHQTIAEAPAVILAIRRSEEGGDRLRPLVTHPELERVDLERLTASGIHAMVRGMLAMDHPPDEFVEFLVQESEGIPFFVAEYLRTALAERLLFRDEQGQWHLVEEKRASMAQQMRFDQTLKLPVSLRSLFERRLRDLSDDATELVELAAVVGRDMPEPMLLSGISGLERDVAGDALTELLNRRILVAPGGDRVRFVHDKFREVVYLKTARSRRRILHRRVARALHDVSLPEQQAALAEHWERGGEPEEARAVYFHAAREALARLAYAEAEVLLRKGLALAGEAPSREVIRARIQLAGGVLALLGRNTDAIAEYHQALSEARELNDRASEALILQRLSRVLRQLGRIDEAETVCRQGLDIHRDLKALGLEGEGLGHLADILWVKGDTTEAARLYGEALTIHRQVGNRLYEGQTLGDLARVYRHQGRLEDAQRLYEKALELVRGLGQQRSEGLLLGQLGELASYQQELPAAVTLIEQALVLHRQTGDRRQEALALAQVGAVSAMRGALSKALALTEQAFELHEGLRDPHSESQLLLQLAYIEAALGKRPLARAHAQRALGFLRRLGERWAQTAALTCLARIEHAAGQLEEAWALLEEALALRQQAREPGPLGEILAALGDVHADQGQLRDARSYYDHALEQFDTFADPAGRWLTALSIARLDRRTGLDPEQLDARLYELDVRLGQVGRSLDVAMCRCERGHLALALDRSAHTFIEQARQIVTQATVEPQSPIGRAVERLHQAQLSWDYGKPLLHGERSEDIPDGLRRQVTQPTTP
ncbi:MAG: hypothetical protein CMH57_12475 [Myxococcales bacterium]|nr:hypothetical protein [Myxococcales bacterium]